MAWTQTDIDTLKAAIASGTQRVRLGEKDIEYRSMADMLKALELMQAEVGSETSRRQPRFQVASFNDAP